MLAQTDLLTRGRITDPAHGQAIPDGEELERVVAREFERQRKAVLAKWQRAIGKGLAVDIAKGGDFDVEEVFDDANFARMTFPYVEIYYDDGGGRKMADLSAKIGYAETLGPWAVKNPHVQTAIANAAMTFSASANRVSQEQLAALTPKVREIIASGTDRGESYMFMAKQVGEVFGQPGSWRSRRIAFTEATRAYHDGQLIAMKDSGVVVGKRWMASGDACEICSAFAVESAAQFIALSEAFGKIGNDPDYSTVIMPPGHPHCRCTVEEVLIEKYRDKGDRERTGPYRPAGRREVPTVEVQTPTPPLPLFWSKATVAFEGFAEHGANDQEAAYKMLDEALGTKLRQKEIASLVGAPHNAKVTVRPLATMADAKVVGAEIDWRAPNGAAAQRLIERKGDQLVVSNEHFMVPKEEQRSGLGTAAFVRQVQSAKNLGFSHIETVAASGGEFNGYYTWPRLGYDGPLQPITLVSLPPNLQTATRVSDLMRTPEGRDWWKQHGRTISLEFDLAKDSLSNRVLAEYVAERKAAGPLDLNKSIYTDNATASGVRHEEIELTAEDDEILDRVWDRIGKGGEA